ncbi:hypothetical protein ACFL3U_00080 [Pseudomonadota bacterium]
MVDLSKTIKYLLDWLKQLLNSSDENDTAWEPYLKEDTNSLTLFQNECNKQLQNALFHFDGLRANQRIEGDDEKYIIGPIPKTKIEYRIYRDAAQIGTYYYLDRQAFKTPELLIASFVKMVKESTQVGEDY